MLKRFRQSGFLVKTNRIVDFFVSILFRGEQNIQNSPITSMLNQIPVLCLLLTLKCLSYFSLPLVHKEGGSTWTHSFLSTFLKEFRYETCATCVYTQIDHISAKRKIKQCFVSKWLPKNELSFREKSHLTKFVKPLFQGNFVRKFGSKLKNTYTFTFFK